MGNTPTKSSKRYSTSTESNIKKIQLGGLGLPAPPGKPVLIPASSEDPQPDIVGIRWERSSSNGGSAIIGYLVEHRRLGSPHWVRSSPNLCTFPELTLSGLEPGWRYQFRVRAQNGLGLSQPSELSDPLTVTLQRSAATSPKFILELKDTVTLENEQAEFTVEFSGTPIPKISWFKDGFEIFSSRRTRIITENGKSILLIHQTALNDEGEIKCTATNRAGHVSTRSRLILEAYPRIRLPRQYEDGLLFKQDETIRLKVSVAGKPPPTVVWFHDGEIINSVERYVIEAFDSGECSMKILAAKRKDRGEYTVKAINKLGEDIASFLVTVTDRPAAPGKATIDMTLGRSVTLSWKEPDDDGGCKIGTYIVEYYRIRWDVWLKAATCRQSTTTLSELIEGSEYKFRVKAENPYGVSDPSDESDIIFIPDPKRGINSPPLRPEKSQSQKGIHRGRSERRQESEYTKRTRSLTREETNYNVSGDDFITLPSRSVSVNKLNPLAPPKPPRVDSRVTFADTIFLHVEKPLEDIAPIPPARPKSKRDKYQSLYKNEDVNVEKTSSVTTIIQQPYLDNIEALEQMVRVKPSSLLIETQQPIIDESKRMKSLLPREESVGDEEFRSSSEFMLVLYPDQENGKQNPLMKPASDEEAEDNDKDLVPPPMSLSLPELFSADHQIVEILRDAVSSTELLHEHAMERFYKAVAVEEAEAAKKSDSGIFEKHKRLDFLSSKLRSSRQKRRLSSESPTSGHKFKWDRRRSSESQASLQPHQNVDETRTLPIPQFIAISNPNLHQDSNTEENYSDQNFSTSISSSLGLHRWDSKSMPLVPEQGFEDRLKSISKESIKENYRYVKTPDRELVKESTVAEYYEESTDEGSESEETDSEDLKTLKHRLLASPVLDEQDTYHPRGRPIAYTLSPEVDHKTSSEYSYQSLLSPLPSNSIQPKSILKKRTEDEPVAFNHFGRPIPPEKPILERQTNSTKKEEIPFVSSVTLRKKSLTDLSDTAENVIPSDINNDNASFLNAAEVAKNRRRPTPKPELEKKSSVEEKEDLEERMAVVDHYTEIVKEYSASHMAFPPTRYESIALQSQRKNNSSQKDSMIEAKQTSEISLVKEKTETRSEKPSTSSSIVTPLDKNPQSSEKQSITKSSISRPFIERKIQSSTIQSIIMPSREPSQDRERSRSSSRIRKREMSRDRESPSSRSSSRQKEETLFQDRSSRGSSKERFRSFDISPSDSETSQKITRRKQNNYHWLERSRKNSLKIFGKMDGINGLGKSGEIHERLIAEAKVNVRSTMSYIIDLIILLAAVYVYLFKKEILAIPLICLLLYRRIQEDIDGWIPNWWRSQPKKG